MKVAPHSNPKAIYVITKATWGGAQRYVWDLLQEATRSDYTPILVYGEAGILSERAKEAGISIYQIGKLTRDISLVQEFHAFRDLYRIFSTFRPKVVHLNSSKASALGAVAARLAGVPHIIFTAHGWAFTESRSLLSKKLFLLVHFITVFLSTQTIAVSDAIRSHTLTWPRVQEKIHVIKNGVGKEFLLARNEARKELCARDETLKEKTTWIGTVAELHTNKGLDVGIEAMRHPKEVEAEWVIIGAGEKETELKKQAVDSPHIHLLGAVVDAQRYMNAFDVFFLPSRTEALGYVLLEAGSAGLPCAATEVGGIPEIIENEVTGLLVPSGDFESMNTALLRLIADSSLRTTLGENLQKKVAKEYSKEKMLSDTFALYALS